MEDNDDDNGARELAELYASMTPVERTMLWTFIFIKLYACRVVCQAFGILVGFTFYRFFHSDSSAVIAISVGILAHFYVYASLRVIAARNI